MSQCRNKSLLVLFFRKEQLSYFPPGSDIKTFDHPLEHRRNLCQLFGVGEKNAPGLPDSFAGQLLCAAGPSFSPAGFKHCMFGPAHPSSLLIQGVFNAPRRT
jgi:hypothetical protein